MMTKDPRPQNEDRYDRMAGSYATIARLLSFGLISRLRQAPALGGYPGDLPLSLLVDRLDAVQTRRLLGGVYILVAGRKPA